MEKEEKDRPINFKIADRSHRLRASPDEERYIRLAAEIINVQIKEYQKQSADMIDALAMVAIDSLVARLKGDDQIAEFQKVVFKNVEHLRHIMNPSELKKE
jgi:uncharacterized membrane protein YheB (UPF0754 family)